MKITNIWNHDLVKYCHDSTACQGTLFLSVGRLQVLRSKWVWPMLDESQLPEENHEISHYTHEVSHSPWKNAGWKLEDYFPFVALMSPAYLYRGYVKNLRGLKKPKKNMIFHWTMIFSGGRGPKIPKQPITTNPGATFCWHCSYVLHIGDTGHLNLDRFHAIDTFRGTSGSAEKIYGVNLYNEWIVSLDHIHFNDVSKKSSWYIPRKSKNQTFTHW